LIPATAETVKVTVSTLMATTMNPLPNSSPVTIEVPVRICRAPMPSEVAVPNRVTNTAKGSAEGLVAAAGGVWLMGLVAFVMPATPALDWLDIIGIFLKLAIFIAGAVLALTGVHLAIPAIATMRTPRE
jgi:hypothetical protein